jgi:hypothetical protein
MMRNTIKVYADLPRKFIRLLTQNSKLNVMVYRSDDLKIGEPQVR